MEALLSTGPTPSSFSPDRPLTFRVSQCSVVMEIVYFNFAAFYSKNMCRRTDLTSFPSSVFSKGAVSLKHTHCVAGHSWNVGEEREERGLERPGNKHVSTSYSSISQSVRGMWGKRGGWNAQVTTCSTGQCS